VSSFPLPDVDWAPLRGFWEGARADELRIPRCSSCAAWCWYPAAGCRACDGQELRWTRTAGRGTLFSWAVVERPLFEAYADWVPYVTGLVALEEDPAVRIVTRLVDCDPGALRVEMPVYAVFRELRFAGVEGSVRAPFFRPSEHR
jgi:uncharacterized OB-fold protein